MCIFENTSKARYNSCIVVGRNETFWEKFASMNFFTYCSPLVTENLVHSSAKVALSLQWRTFWLQSITISSVNLSFFGSIMGLLYLSLILRIPTFPYKPVCHFQSLCIVGLRTSCNLNYPANFSVHI